MWIEKCAGNGGGYKLNNKTCEVIYAIVVGLILIFAFAGWGFFLYKFSIISSVADNLQKSFNGLSYEQKAYWECGILPYGGGAIIIIGSMFFILGIPMIASLGALFVFIKILVFIDEKVHNSPVKPQKIDKVETDPEFLKD